MLRLTLALVAGWLALTPSAAAETPFLSLHFAVGADGVAQVHTPNFSEPDTRLELVRAGHVVASTAGALGPGITLTFAGLQAGDEARVVRDGEVGPQTTYDGDPLIEGACAGRSTFSFTRGGLDAKWQAGVLPVGSPADRFPVPDRTDGPATVPVSVGRPLAEGDVVFATIMKLDQGVVIHSRRAVRVGPCAAPAPTAAQVRATVKAAAAQAKRNLRKIRRGALMRGGRFTLPVTFSEPGTYRLRLVARGHTVATGTRARRVAGQANVTLTFRAKARATLTRTRRVALKLRFTPARAGTDSQHARTSVRLRGGARR